MTPEQTAAYINAQAALMLVELEKLKAHYRQMAVDECQNVTAVWDAIPHVEFIELQKQFSILTEPAIGELFQRANDHAHNVSYQGPR